MAGGVPHPLAAERPEARQRRRRRGCCACDGGRSPRLRAARAARAAPAEASRRCPRSTAAAARRPARLLETCPSAASAAAARLAALLPLAQLLPPPLHQNKSNYKACWRERRKLPPPHSRSVLLHALHQIEPLLNTVNLKIKKASCPQQEHAATGTAPFKAPVTYGGQNEEKTVITQQEHAATGTAER